MKFGPYEVRRELGRGGFGRVYLAVRDGREVALKVLEGVADPELVVRFKRESETLARAAGESIVAVHDARTAEGRLWFAMDLVPGGSLREALRARGTLPWREAVAHVAQVARGSSAATPSGSSTGT